MKINRLDKIKEKKFSPLTTKEMINQNLYFEDWVYKMLKRKCLGNEKYGNYMMDVDKETSFKELEEEMYDVCNHLIMLTYKLKKRLAK